MTEKIKQQLYLPVKIDYVALVRELKKSWAEMASGYNSMVDDLDDLTTLIDGGTATSTYIDGIDGGSATV